MERHKKLGEKEKRGRERIGTFESSSEEHEISKLTELVQEVLQARAFVNSDVIHFGLAFYFLQSSWDGSN